MGSATRGFESAHSPSAGDRARTLARLDARMRNATRIADGGCLRQEGLVARILSCEHFDHAVAPAADDPAAVLAPHDGTDPFAAHESVAGDLLRACPLLERPESQACVVARRDELTPVRRE